MCSVQASLHVLWIQRDGESEGQRNVIGQSGQLSDVCELLQLLKHSNTSAHITAFNTCKGDSYMTPKKIIWTKYVFNIQYAVNSEAQ